jgi:hypothetical protein
MHEASINLSKSRGDAYARGSLSFAVKRDFALVFLGTG